MAIYIDRSPTSGLPIQVPRPAEHRVRMVCEPTYEIVQCTGGKVCTVYTVIIYNPYINMYYYP